jgi:hypothetical protein
VDCADLGEVLSDDGLKGISGRIYLGVLYIERTPLLQTEWNLLIERSEWQGDDLESLEARLYVFAIDDGYGESAS